MQHIVIDKHSHKGLVAKWGFHHRRKFSISLVSGLYALQGGEGRVKIFFISLQTYSRYKV